MSENYITLKLQNKLFKWIQNFLFLQLFISYQLLGFLNVIYFVGGCLVYTIYFKSSHELPSFVFYFLIFYSSNTINVFQVILIQEQLSKNRIIIDNDKKGKWVLVSLFLSLPLFLFLIPLHSFSLTHRELTKDYIRSDTELHYMVFNLLDHPCLCWRMEWHFPLPFDWLFWPSFSFSSPFHVPL